MPTMATTTGIPAQVHMHRYFILFYFLINHSAPSRCHDNSGADDNDTHARRNDNTTHDDTHEAKTHTHDAMRRDDDTHAQHEDTHARRDDDGVHDAKTRTPDATTTVCTTPTPMIRLPGYIFFFFSLFAFPRCFFLLIVCTLEIQIFGSGVCRNKNIFFEQK
jgi:hypothetical protein